MFTITILIGNQSTAINIHPNHTARQILDYLKQDGRISKFQANVHLHFNGAILPPDTPVSHFGIGPNATLSVVSNNGPGFGGGGKETLLATLLKAFTNLK